jgi:hypothetical protein
MSENHSIEKFEFTDGHRGSFQRGHQQMQTHPSVKKTGSGTTFVLFAKQKNEVRQKFQRILLLKS